jgi:NADH dehydrogenase
MRNAVVTVFGGTGFIGRHLVQRLAQRGAAVRVVTRDPDRAGFLRPMGDVGQIAILPYAEDEVGLRKLIDGSMGVVNLLGILFERRSGDFMHVHRDMAEQIAKTAAAVEVRRLVHMSAIGADPSGAALYAKSKGEGERRVKAAFPKASIIRSSIVFGPGDGFFARFAQMSVLSPFLPLIDGGKTCFQPVYVGDVAEAMARCLESDEHQGQTFELGGPKAATFEQLLRYVLKTVNRRRLLLPLPSSVAAVQARFLEFLPTPPLTRDQLKMLATDNVVSEDAATLRTLGIEPTPYEVIVPQYLKPFARPPRRAQPVA